jgi:holo-[acyl-carrier protein] synthase
VQLSLPELRVGVDVVPVDRVARLLSEHEGAAAALFTEREQAYCRDRAERLAARFAAKEAVLKAFGTGVAHGIRWTDVEVVNEPGGRPAIELHGAAGELARRRGLDQIDVSLTHSGGLAAAHALLVYRPCAST